MENLGMSCAFANAFAGKRVFVTGHTGFKGAWLSEWLIELGAEVTGYSHEVLEDRCLFRDLDLEQRMTHVIGDVRESEALLFSLDAAKPDYVFHLAAQSLVRYSYDHPVETIDTNVMGTAHVLDALRRLNRPVACVIVTSDKCYENREVLTGYREDDPFGGKDPYSASKGAAEIVAQAYRRSYFSDPHGPVKVAVARAGNVIGGGDWSADRIVPDCIRDLQAGRPVAIRNPAATRPWQHVLEALSGYMWLGALLSGAATTARVRRPADVFDGFNFGPWPTANVSVGTLVESVLSHWPGSWEHKGNDDDKPEAALLALTIDKAFHTLGWQPALGFAKTVEITTLWYRNVLDGTATAAEQTAGDIALYTATSRSRSIPWAG